MDDEGDEAWEVEDVDAPEPLVSWLGALDEIESDKEEE